MNGFSRYLLSTLLLLLAGTASAEVETVTWLHTDHLGSPLMARDAQGNTLWQEDYSPWGERLAAPSANSADIGYTGHYEEADIGLTYAQARWYDPAVGRFLSADAVEVRHAGARYFNRYAYTANNPFNYTDPDGNAAQALEIGALGAVALCLRNPACVSTVGGLLSGAGGFALGYNNEAAEGGASDAPLTELDSDSDEWIYGPEDDPKINQDGSTSGPTWTTPDDYSSQEEAQDRLDPFKPMEGRRPVRIPKGTKVRTGVTPGGEGPYSGNGGARETLVEEGLPPGSVGVWEPL